MSEELPGVLGAVTTSDLVLQAFSEPNRRMMLELVAAKEMPSGEIAAHFNVTRQAVSQHLRVLKEAGLVEERRVGRHRVYRARADGIAVLHQYLNDLWSSSLALAKDIAEKTADDASPSEDADRPDQV